MRPLAAAVAALFVCLLVVSGVLWAAGTFDDGSVDESASAPASTNEVQGDAAETPSSTVAPSVSQSEPNEDANTDAGVPLPETSTTTSTTTTTTTEAPRIRGSNLFVSPTGTDEPDGGWTFDDPLRSPNFAVEVSRPGDTIHLLPGDYEPLEISGRDDLTVSAPQGGVTLSSGSYEQRAGVLVEDSTNIVIDGLRTERSLWGIRVFASHGVVVRNNEVFDTGQEAIHVLARSTDVTIENNLVDTTGQRVGSSDGLEFRDRGEGIYLGTGGQFEGGVDDVSNVRILGNIVRNVTAEAVEIKASVFDVVVRGNLIHDVDVHSGAAVSIGRGTRTYDANVIVENNAIWNVTARDGRPDGIGVRVSSPATVQNNAIWNTQHHGIKIDTELRAVDGAVSVVDNVIATAGVSSVDDDSADTGVSVTIVGTREGSIVTDIVGDLDSPDVDGLVDRLQDLS